MKNDTQTDIAAATDALEHGYREETHLYMHVSRLTWKQHDALREGSDLVQFDDIRDEKEDLLKMVEEIESGMRAAQAFVLSKGPSVCLGRFRLNGLLDRLMETLEEIRIVESDNASLLDAILLRSGLSGVWVASADAREGRLGAWGAC